LELFSLAALATFGSLGGCGAPKQYREHSIPAMFSPSPPKRAAPSKPVRLELRDAEVVAGGMRLVLPDRARPTPEFALRDESGFTHTPATLRGRVVWIDLWAEWCATCRAEFPRVQALHEKLSPAGLTILGVCRNSTRPGFEAASRKKWITFAMIDASRDSSFPFPYGAFPTSIVIDRAGRVRAFWQGHRSRDSVEGLLTRLLEEELPEREAELAAGAFGERAEHSQLLASEAVLAASLEIASEDVGPGALVEGKIVLDLLPGWHLCAEKSPGSIPLEVRLDLSPELAHLDYSLPRARRLILLGAEREVYSGRVVLPLWGVVRREAREGSRARISVTATAQACNATSCLAPSEIRLSRELKITRRGSDRWFFQ
jgi:thiol-disulfide isomerase/thioredoxin